MSLCCAGVLSTGTGASTSSPFFLQPPTASTHADTATATTFALRFTRPPLPPPEYHVCCVVTPTHTRPQEETGATHVRCFHRPTVLEETGRTGVSPNACC